MSPDILIIGAGIGGATAAIGLANSGANILIVERGDYLTLDADARSTSAIFADNKFRTAELWHDETGAAFNPGNFYCVGGNSKVYGAALLRFRAEDFAEREHPGGVSPAWPFDYEALEKWYCRAEQLFQVRGDDVNADPSEPPHSLPYPHAAVADEPAIATMRARLQAQGLHPSSLPLGVDLDAWLQGGQTPWDGFPNTGGKMDAESCALAKALRHANVQLQTNTKALRLRATADGKRINQVEVQRGGEVQTIAPGTVILAAGAVNSAAILLRSDGVANRGDQVGRCFMNHNCTAMLAVDPRRRNDSVYQKTLAVHDFYLRGDDGGLALGAAQLLGKIDGVILKANLPRVPLSALDFIARHSVDWYLISEDLPDADSRVRVDGARIILQWKRTNLAAHARLTSVFRRVLKRCGYPIVLAKPFDRRTPSHQCGTARMGDDPATSVVDANCKVWDCANLYIADASVLPTSAAVNPALTVAALALRLLTPP